MHSIITCKTAAFIPVKPVFGKLIIEVPYFSGYHHQHMFFYNLTFFERLCSDNALKIVDINTDNNALLLVITHSADTTYRKARLTEKPAEMIKLASNLKNRFDDKISRLKNLLIGHKDIVWWGSGSSSIVLLNQIPRNILKGTNLTVVDGDENKWQFYIPGINIKVKPFTVLKEKDVGLLIVASQFYNEIIKTINNAGIVAKQIEHIYD